MYQQNPKNPGLRRLWRASAWAFVIAASAGILFRWSLMAGIPEGWNLAYIRHGHSHLMLMGWATPALMALMAARWPHEGGSPANRSVTIVGWTAWLLSMLSFPAFLVYGYESVAIGSAELPIAAILSGLAIFAWYAFAAVYFRATRGVQRTPTMRLWDLAVLSLVISSFGAWAVAALMMSGVDSLLWETATVHFFVELFGGGWLVLGSLGLIRSRVDLPDSTNERVARILIGAAVAFVFLIGLPRSETPEAWPILGSAAAGLVAAGMALLLQRLRKQVDIWNHRVLLILTIQVIMLAALAIPPLAEWGLSAGLRVFYLHIAFAGFVTMALVVAAYHEWGKSIASPTTWLVGISALLVTMIPLTGLWPSELAGTWTLDLVFIGAVIATVSVLVGQLRTAF